MNNHRLKRCFTVLLLVLCLLLSACRDGGGPPAADLPSTPSEAISSIPQESAQEPGGQSVSSAQKDEANASLEGKYYETSYRPDSEEYSHMLELNEDGTFTLRVNLAAAMGNVTGSYEVGSETIRCSVDQVHFSGFAGDRVTEFSFRIIDATHLEYLGEPIAYIDTGNIFEKDFFG